MIRICAAIAAVGFLISAYSYHNHKIRSEAVTNERARVAEKAENNHAQASANRATVTDANVRRMLEKYYRDKH